MVKVNEDLFLSDYNSLEAEKENANIEADEIVKTIKNISDEAKQEIKDIVIREKIAEIDNKKAFYEKYLVKIEDDIEYNNQYQDMQ